MMIGLPDINLVTTVYFPPDERGAIREEGFRQSLQSWYTNLMYEGNINLIVINDGPALEPYREWDRGQLCLGHERNGMGGSLNVGFKTVFEHSPLVLNVLDDLLLMKSFDLTPWAQLLLEDEHFGAIRLMAPHPDTSGRITPLWKTPTEEYGWGIIFDRHNLAAGLLPTLYHKRFFDAYGWFEENISAWDCEKLFNDKFCQLEGPEIVMPLPPFWKGGIGSSVELGQESPVGT
jgi:hypothetical protein